jgi:hypothetical protein
MASCANASIIFFWKWTSNAATNPNICVHFAIPCIDLEEFMRQQDWQF